MPVEGVGHVINEGEDSSRVPVCGTCCVTFRDRDVPSFLSLEMRASPRVHALGAGCSWGLGLVWALWEVEERGYQGVAVTI